MSLSESMKIEGIFLSRNEYTIAHYHYTEERSAVFDDGGGI